MLSNECDGTALPIEMDLVWEEPSNDCFEVESSNDCLEVELCLELTSSEYCFGVKPSKEDVTSEYLGVWFSIT